MTPRDLLVSGAQELGLPLASGQVDALFVYLAELKKWNRKINLTGITSDREAVIKHLLDSLAYLHGFAAGPGVRLLDMGSGAGFPAIPLLIARPGLSVTMVESVRKKCAFLRHALRTLDAGTTEVLDQRTDELPAAYENTYSVVTARAFAGMSAALAEGGRFLSPGGLMVLSRGPEETLTAEEAARAGFGIEKRTELTLPHSDNRRSLWVFRKQGVGAGAPER